MYIRQTTKKVKDKVYENYLLVESIMTPKGPRQITICSLSYFEGDCLLNPQAKRGYSRDKRFDAKQVVVGLVIDRDGFPKAHEIFFRKPKRL